jgi:hypothetical protein
MNYARIENKAVREVFRAPDGFTLADCMHPEVAALFEPVAENVTVGSTINDQGVWTICPPPPVDTPQPVVVDDRITRLAFINRFTMDEWIAIDAGTANVPTLKYFIAKVNAARYIELGRLETRNGVKLIEANGLIAAGRVAEILDAPIRDIERLDGDGV